MDIQKIETNKAPGAVGPYSQAIKCGGLVFISGQTPIAPATGKIVEGAIADQAQQSLEKLSAIARAAGTHIAKAVKTLVFLTDMDDFAAVNAEYAKYFPDQKPARSCIAVKALPLGARVEIEAICAE